MGRKCLKCFYVYLATKPTFISVKVDAITPIPGSKFYNLDLTVIYTGADYLYVEKSEEYSDIVDTHFFYIPYIVHLRFEYIYMIGTSWVDLRISNKIGKAYYTV